MFGFAAALSTCFACSVSRHAPHLQGWRTASEGGPYTRKPRARRLLERIGLRQLARTKAGATLKNEERLPPQDAALHGGWSNSGGRGLQQFADGAVHADD